MRSSPFSFRPEDFRSAAARSAGRARTHAGVAFAWAAPLVLGVTVLLLGSGLGILGVLAGIALSGLSDRRLPLVLLLVASPSLTAVHSLHVVTIGGHALDVRLTLTGAIPLLLLVPVATAIVRRRGGGLHLHDPIPGLLVLFVAWAALVAPLNTVAPANALPPLARYAGYLSAYLAARWWFDEPSRRIIPAAIVAGAVIPLLSGIAQYVTGGALEMNEARRLTGVYGLSPIGLGFEMAIAAVVVYGVFLPHGRRRWRGVAPLAALFVAFALVLIETASRLVFVGGAAALVLMEAAATRYRRAIGVAAIVLAVGLVHPGLSTRLSSPVDAGDPTGGDEAGDPTGGDEAGDSSLGFRLVVWQTMLPEWAASPLAGRGTGSFATLFEQHSGLPRVAPHNDYLGILVELGVVGLSLYVLLQVAVLRAALRRCRDPALRRSTRTLAVAAGAIFLAINVIGAINNAIFFLDIQLAVWALCGAALAPGGVTVTSSRTPPRGNESQAADAVEVLRPSDAVSGAPEGPAMVRA